MNFVFDVDGTLTDSRCHIDLQFSKWFSQWMVDKTVYLATGSDYAKTLEQLGPDICNNVTAIYNCSGNAVFVKGILVRENKFTLTSEQILFLQKLIDHSPFELRTGNHIESRIGMYNFSVLGRLANQEQRAQYYAYDLRTGERNNFANLINLTFPEIEATVGGETGIDLYLRGNDKSQIADEVKPFVFFGDKIFPGGNDFTIAKFSEKSYKVASWQETWEILRLNY